MQPHEARPSIAVRVHKSYRKPEFAGMLGMFLSEARPCGYELPPRALRRGPGGN
jgi:hypothetical protein